MTSAARHRAPASLAGDRSKVTRRDILARAALHGPRVGESGFGLIPGFAYTGPYEDITIKAKS